MTESSYPDQCYLPGPVLFTRTSVILPGIEYFIRKCVILPGIEYFIRKCVILPEQCYFSPEQCYFSTEQWFSQTVNSGMFRVPVYTLTVVFLSTPLAPILGILTFYSEAVCHWARVRDMHRAGGHRPGSGGARGNGWWRGRRGTGAPPWYWSGCPLPTVSPL